MTYAAHAPPEEETMAEYLMESDWLGWLGGFGSESVKTQRLNARATEGWRLVRTESKYLWWFFILPRVKILYIWERTKAEAA